MANNIVKNLPSKIQEELSAYFGVTPRTVARWASEIKPLNAEKLIDYLKSSRLREGLISERIFSSSFSEDLHEIFGSEKPLDSDSNDPSESLQSAKLRKIQLETQRIQLGLDRDRGDVVSRAALREAGVRIGAALAAAVAALDNDLPGLLAGKSEVEIRAAVTPRLARMQETFNEALMEVVDEPAC